MTDSRSLLGGSIVKGMIVIIFFGLFLKLGGFLMSLIVGRFYGPGSVLDSYSHVFNILLYVFVYSTLLSVVMPAFMPIFSQTRLAKGDEEAWKLASTLLNATLLGALLVAVGAFIFSEPIIGVLVPGFSGEQRMVTASMLRGMSPGVVVFVFALIAMAILNSYKVFSYPSAAEAAQRLFWAATLFCLIALFAMNRGPAPHLPVVIGFLCGSAVQVGVLLYGLRRFRGLYRFGFPALSSRRVAVEAGLVLLFAGAFALWTLAVRVAPAWMGGGAAEHFDEHSGFFILTGGLLIGWAYAGLLWARAKGATSEIGRFACLAAPLMFGVIFARYRNLADAYFQSYTEPGDFGLIELARRIINLPTMLVAYSLSLAMFPYLCDLAAKKDNEAFGAVYRRTIRMIALFFVPLTAVTALAATPVMRFVFDPGNWSQRDIRQAGLALTFFSAGFFFYAIEYVLMQTYFSMQRVVVPTFLGMAMTVLHVGAMFSLIQIFGFDQPSQIFLIVIVAFPANRGIKNLILMALIRKRIASPGMRSSLAFLGRLAIVTAAAGGAALLGLAGARLAFDPDDHAPRSVMLDTFEPEDEEAADGPARGIEQWTALRGREMRLDTLEEAPDKTEHALHFPEGAAARRDLVPFGPRLEGVTHLGFKAKTPVERELRVRLVSDEGEWTAAVDVAASGDRASYSVALADFTGEGELRPTGLTALEIEDADDERAPLWLDNVAFARPQTFQGRLRFEAAKGAHVALPGLGATLAFLGACFGLRFEEFMLIVAWVRNKGWKKAKRGEQPPGEAAP